MAETSNKLGKLFRVPLAGMGIKANNDKVIAFRIGIRQVFQPKVMFEELIAQSKLHIQVAPHGSTGFRNMNELTIQKCLPVFEAMSGNLGKEFVDE